MPFVSEKQRRFFWAMLRNPRLRRRRGVSLKAARRMTKHDKGGRLPAVSRATRGSLRRSKRRRRRT